MYFWMLAPIRSWPTAVLFDWKVIRTERGDCHLAGCRLDIRDGYVTSPIVRFDPETQRGLTDSGYVHELRGMPRENRFVTWALEDWARIVQQPYADMTDVVAAYLEKLRIRSISY